MEPMQLVRARPASCIGSDDRASFYGDCYEAHSHGRRRTELPRVPADVRERRLHGVCVKHTSRRQVVERLAARRLLSSSMRTSHDKSR